MVRTTSSTTTAAQTSVAPPPPPSTSLRRSLDINVEIALIAYVFNCTQEEAAIRYCGVYDEAGNLVTAAQHDVTTWMDSYYANHQDNLYAHAFFSDGILAAGEL